MHRLQELEDLVAHQAARDMASTVEFMLDPSLLDAHLAKLSTDKTLRPSAVELVQALLDLAGSSQAKREGLLLSLAAQLSRKAGLTLEALERAVPMKHQLVLLREMASIQPSSRVVTCNVSRWMLRVHLRGQEGRGFVVDGNDADQAVLTLIALLEQGCVLDGTDDEGGARSRAYLCAISCDLGSWFFNARALQPAEKWLRHSLDLFRKVEEDENGLCEVKEERLTALAIALRMLRVSIPRAPPSPKIEEMGDTGHPSADSKSILGEMASQRPPLLMAAEILRLSDYTERYVLSLSIGRIEIFLHLSLHCTHVMQLSPPRVPFATGKHLFLPMAFPAVLCFLPAGISTIFWFSPPSHSSPVRFPFPLSLSSSLSPLSAPSSLSLPLDSLFVSSYPSPTL